MIRTLFVIAAAGLVLAMVCFGAVLALGGRDLLDNGWSIRFEEGRGLVAADSRDRFDPGPMTERELAWTGADRLSLDLPGEVIFVQGEPASVRVSGPEALVERVVLDGGRLSLEADGRRPLRWRGRERLSVAITAPDVSRFTVNGSGDLDIRDFDQDTIEVRVNGGGDVAAAGRARVATAEVSGSGEIDLSAMALDEARIHVSGSGDIRAAPTEAAEVGISGSGDVRLDHRPARLVQNVRGSGDVRVAD